MIHTLMEDRVLVLGMSGCGGVEVQLHVSLNSALGWRRMVSLTPTPRYKVEEVFPLLTEQDTGWAPEPV